MAVALSNSVCVKVCRALGLDPCLVRDLVIELRLDEAVTVYVVKYLDADKVDPLSEALASCDRPKFVECKSVSVDERGNVQAKQ